MNEFISSIERIAEAYSQNLNSKIEGRKLEMQEDDTSHYLIYRVLGITLEDGELIDIYQNTGRFLYKYAGSFLEEAASLCFKYKFPDGGKVNIANTISQRPKKFEIDFLNDTDAIEIKWRDATTDGDHITKERTRVSAIRSNGFTPIRVMFYYPLRVQARKVQKALKAIYAAEKGHYYSGDDAWAFVLQYTGVDLMKILTSIADKRVPTVSQKIADDFKEVKGNANE